MPTYSVNEAAVQKVRALIKARRYVLKSKWGDVQPDTEAQNRFLKRHGWDEYSEWHLALNDGKNDGTKARYGFGFGDFKRVHRSALIACHFRAAEWRHKEIELIAHQLLQELDEATWMAKRKAGRS